jgi:single-strand DNA-binding protein
MFSTNRVTLIGFLGKDADVRRTRTEKPFTVVSLATNRKWKDSDSGEYKSEVSWHRCIAFGRAGEYAATLTKGMQVQVEGEIRTRSYADPKAKGSAQKSITEIRVYRIAKLERPDKGTSQGAAA